MEDRGCCRVSVVPCPCNSRKYPIPATPRNTRESSTRSLRCCAMPSRLALRSRGYSDLKSFPFTSAASRVFLRTSHASRHRIIRLSKSAIWSDDFEEDEQGAKNAITLVRCGAWFDRGRGTTSGKRMVVKYRRIVIHDQRVTSAKKSGFAGVLRGIGGSTITRK